ncbi:hypothetical protein M2347_002521 [Chryseobacterium sp. H1D6B]|uniref:hypothetical protein n=1 Tax=Chryseobacterium sp. H1D6B TaxID=2940588 RepID=UPI0015C7AF0F|nr:hypothetical protein [Chryseobacterium sp. H1D6B]MDH6252794.1 hypothetical protein [Chryseobacterium sp. H1D6B]
MQEEFITYHKFNNENEAEDFASLLKENGVDALVVNNSLRFDASFANNEFNKEFLVKIESKNFQQAENLLTNYYESEIDNVEPDYYLFSSTDDELTDMLKNSEEWNEFDIALAKKILKDRNIEINYNSIKKSREEKIIEQSKPDKAESWHLTAGYIVAFLGGFLGIFYGWFLMNHKKTLPNGTRIQAYGSNDRQHGKRILILGIVCLITWTVMKFVD